MTTVPQPHVDVQRLEQNLCRDQPCSRASGHPTILMAAAVLGTVLASAPVTLRRSRSQNPFFLTAVWLCPALGARSPPRPTEREQEVEEKNRCGRVRGCQLSTRLPFAPALRCPRGGEAKGSRAFAGLSQSPGACWQGRGRQRKFRSCSPAPPPQCLLPGAACLPWSRLESSCAKSTWPSLNITQSRLCLCQFGVLLGEPRLTPLKIHGVFLPLLLINTLRGLGDRIGSGTKGSRTSPAISRCFHGALLQVYTYIPVSGLFRRRLARHLCQNHFRFV